MLHVCIFELHMYPVLCVCVCVCVCVREREREREESICIWKVPRDFDPCEFICTVSKSTSLYLTNSKRYGLPIFNALYHTIALCVNIAWCIAQALGGPIPLGFKTVTSSSRFKSLHIRCVHRGVLSLMIGSVC